MSALAVLVGLCSCGLEEPYAKADETDATIEFVGRPVGFNNQTVDTKSEASGIENTVTNCYFLLFDASGNKVYMAGGPAESLQSFRIPKTELAAQNITSVTACYLVNVPASFVNGITGLTNPNPGTNDDQYINTAVIDIPEYQSGTPMGVPKIDHDNDPNTPLLACIPMFGQSPEPITLSSNTTLYQIPVKRLFAKVTMDLSLELELDGWNDIVQRSTYYKLNNYTLYNLPKKVALEGNTSESKWISTQSSFGNSSSGSLNQSIIYNKSGNYAFYLYVPEYYLNSKNNPSTDQRYKPQNVKSGTYPIYVKLNGSYTEYSYRAVTMEHNIYLGRDAHSDFSLERNIHYTNKLIIKGVSNHAGAEAEANIDHRVTTDIIHNPVEVEGESANCYIIAQTGTYSFPAYKGAYKDLENAELCKGDENSTVEVIASDNDGITILNGEYDEDSNFISFKVDNIADGNVVIALKNGDDIEWSWHLWCNSSSTVGDWIGNMTGWGEMDKQTYPNGKKLMDRNLGASSTSSTLNEGIGLYYQYGNKNPFIGSGYSGGGTNGNATWYAPTGQNDANGNPITEKAINDPCPPGYKIPDNMEETWSSSTSFDNSTLDASGLFSEGVLRIYNNPEAVYFPYSAYQGASSAKKTSNTDVYIEEELSRTGVIHRFQKTTINTNITTTYGAIWTNQSGKAREYYFGTIKLKDIVSNFTFISGEMKTSRWGNYSYVESIDWAATQSLKTLLAIGTEKESYDFYEADYSITTGLQVRCVEDE